MVVNKFNRERFSENGSRGSVPACLLQVFLFNLRNLGTHAVAGGSERLYKKPLSAFT
ncbi:MAG: hypothetical protein IPP37_03155 [Saprospiraceae bacterium]|nr:hypothetical protein [Saprospiraceae bacterium]